MTAAKLIALRLVLAVVAIVIFPISALTAYAAIVLFLANDVIDLFDGLLSEHQGQPKPFGGFLDISTDQCIETLFWFVFLQHGLVPLWIPVVILIRNSFINLLRVSAIADGRSMFGQNGMLRSRFAQRWVGARASRGAMVVAKTIGFVALIILYVGETYGVNEIPLTLLSLSAYRTIAITSLTLLVVIHIFRGIVITWESKNFLEAFHWNSVKVQINEQKQLMSL